VDRERLLGHLDDTETATKRKELMDLLSMTDLAAVDDLVIAAAKSPFAVIVRANDAIHVATAEMLAAEAGEPVEFWTHDDPGHRGAVTRSHRARRLATSGHDPLEIVTHDRP
jgi:hypothetical protein